MYEELENVKFGLLLALCGLFLGIGLGIAFGIFEDNFKDFVARGIVAAPELHDEKSQSKIWRYAQRAHFHAAAIAAFSIALIILTMFSNMKISIKPIAAGLIGLSTLYSLSWFAKFYLAPALGRDAAANHIFTQSMAVIGVLGLVLGCVILFANIFLGVFAERKVPEIMLVKLGLLLTLMGLVFGVGLGIAFGVNEDGFKNAVAQGIAAMPDLHDAKSQSKIWRYAQRAHFHAAAISAFSLGLIILIMISNLKNRLKSVTSILIGLGSVYPLAWFAMFWLAPWIGRKAAHDHILTESLVYVGVGSLTFGLLILSCNLFLGWFPETLMQRRLADVKAARRPKSRVDERPRYAPDSVSIVPELPHQDREKGRQGGMRGLVSKLGMLVQVK